MWSGSGQCIASEAMTAPSAATTASRGRISVHFFSSAANLWQKDVIERPYGRGPGQEGAGMTYFDERAITQVTDDELLIPGGLGRTEPDLRDQLARAEEARADERSKRMTAEAAAEHLAELIAAEHVNVVAERDRADLAEAALANAERTAKEMAELVQAQSDRADRAEEASRQALAAYLDDPFRAVEGPPSRVERLRAKLGR
jgi:hypothetical protein